MGLLEGSRITLAVHPDAYYASRIARAVEDSDTQLLGLEIDHSAPFDGAWRVVLTINRIDPTAAARSLERYGFEVVDTTEPYRVDDDTARLRALELLHYLEI